MNNNINGDGKEYYEDGKLKLVGKYRYDKKWNGKRYDLFGNIIYELKEGKGLIKEYLSNNKLIFEGEYLNGQRNGKRKKYYVGKLVFEGEFLNGIEKGKGKGYYYNDKFEGEYLNGNRNGKGKEYY